MTKPKEKKYRVEICGNGYVVLHRGKDTWSDNARAMHHLIKEISSQRTQLLKERDDTDYAKGIIKGREQILKEIIKEIGETKYDNLGMGKMSKDEKMGVDAFKMYLKYKLNS